MPTQKIHFNFLCFNCGWQFGVLNGLKQEKLVLNQLLSKTVLRDSRVALPRDSSNLSGYFFWLFVVGDSLHLAFLYIKRSYSQLIRTILALLVAALLKTAAGVKLRIV
jgi:hypothetical protein